MPANSMGPRQNSTPPQPILANLFLFKDTYVGHKTNAFSETGCVSKIFFTKKNSLKITPLYTVAYGQQTRAGQGLQIPL